MRKASRVNTPKPNRAKNPEAYIKVPISMPKDIFQFADDKATAISKASGEPKNFSKYMRDLVRRDKEQEGAKEA